MTRLKENLPSPVQPGWSHSRSENGKVEEGFNARPYWANEGQIVPERPGKQWLHRSKDPCGPLETSWINAFTMMSSERSGLR